MKNENTSKTILKKRENGSTRVQLDVSHPKLTDQSFKNSTDINVIMRQYSKTGILPQSRQGHYSDVSNLPPLETLFDIVNTATESFQSLPSQIRKLMDNDPSKLESFIQNPENQDLLVKYGLKKQVDVSPQEKQDPPPAGKKETKVDDKKE